MIHINDHIIMIILVCNVRRAYSNVVIIRPVGS